MRIAAIDLGTNSFHLLVVEARPDGSFVPLVREKEMLRLGDEVARTGRVSRASFLAAVDTVRRFKALADHSRARAITACATSAFRDAANGAALAAAIEAETGVRARIVDGQEEARLIYTAVRQSVRVERKPLLGLDLGGGSLEVMVGDAADLWWADSLPLGVARLSAELVRHDPPSDGDRRRLQKRLGAALEPLAADLGARFGAAFARHGTAVGSGGTFCDLARMLVHRRTGALPLSVNQVSFRRHELEALNRTLWSSSSSARHRLPGLEARRADLVPAGSMVLLMAMELFRFNELTVSGWALREGMVLDSLARAGAEAAAAADTDIRLASVVALGRRCNWDEPHCRHVARLAGALFDATRRLHRLESEDRELLEHAALLHDIGEHVSVLAHHKHTSYLIQHGRLRGFSPGEVDALAALARYGSRGEPKPSHKPFKTLDAKARARVVKLAALLRVAAGLDRGRRQVVGSVAVDVGSGRVTLHIRSASDCELERWAASRQGDAFARAFGRSLHVAAPLGAVSSCGAAGAR